MDLNLKGKVALVTGGGTGIGAGISDYLAEEGVQVAINYIVDGPAVEAFASELSRKHGSRAVGVYGDVSKPSDAEAMVEATLRQLGRIDILVNNAGIWPTEDILAICDSAWDRVIDINLNGPFYLARRVARHLVEAGRRGTIVNISSKSGFQLSTGGHAHYATAKAGVAMLTRALARELTAWCEPRSTRTSGEKRGSWIPTCPASRWAASPRPGRSATWSPSSAPTRPSTSSAPPWTAREAC
jgi:NAD(P)-dependent dehydrogenase (short-subunit alcohol dehydrogenase family)